MNWLFLAAATTAPMPEPIDMAWQFRQHRPPIVSVSRESAEPPLLEPTVKQSLTVRKTCLCSPACVCGCNEGRPCQCKTNSSEFPNSSTNTGGAVSGGIILSPLSAIHHTPPVRSLVPTMPSFFGRPASMAAPSRNC